MTFVLMSQNYVLAGSYIAKIQTHKIHVDITS